MNQLSQTPREAIANGLLPTTGRIDKRQRTVARYRDAARDFIRLLGGPDRVNAFELEIIRRAASLCVLADRAEAQLLSDPDKVDAKGYIKLSKQLHLLFLSLGLKREYRHGTRLVLEAHGEAPEDWSVEVDEDYEDEDDAEEEPELLAIGSTAFAGRKPVSVSGASQPSPEPERSACPTSDQSEQPEQPQSRTAVLTTEEDSQVAEKTSVVVPPPELATALKEYHPYPEGCDPESPEVVSVPEAPALAAQQALAAEKKALVERYRFLRSVQVRGNCSPHVADELEELERKLQEL